jgi:hypothetical protein
VADLQHAISNSGHARESLPATAQGFKHWWTEYSANADGAVELGFFNRTTIYRLRLQTDHPPGHADWFCETGKEWSGAHIVFHLEARGATSYLRFTHAGWQSETEYFVNCNTTWGELMFRLKAAREERVVLSF